MAGQFRQRRFSGRGGLGEDVNPSAYIVNLADCMLVLTCGVIVALVSYFDVDLTGIQKLEDEQMKPIDPQTMPEDIGEGGSYYVEAGIVYMDPSTGQMYIVENAEPGASQETNPVAEPSAEPPANNNEIQNSRANGAD
jgi:hypothetical protein